MNDETYNAKTATGKVHRVRDGRLPHSAYKVQLCDGRAVTGMARTDEALTCARCLAKDAAREADKGRMAMRRLDAERRATNSRRTEA